MTMLITLLLTFTFNNINYKIVNEEAVVTRNSEIKGEVTIPTTVQYKGNTYFVTAIGDSAFYDCYEMTAVTLPKNIDSIGSFAFFNTSIPKPVFTKTIFAYLPYDFQGEYKMPSTITEICGGAFFACGDLTSVVLPDKLQKIGGNAFLASGITVPVMTKTHFAYLPTQYKGRFVIPNGITTITDGAFYDCEELTRVIIPNTVTKIGASAFATCYKLDSVFIPEGVTEIQPRTFEYCKRLIHVTLPPRLERIGDNAFAECVWLSNIDFGQTQIRHIGEKAFFDCRALQRLQLMEGLISIDDEAFAQCNDLREANMPQSVVKAGRRIFHRTQIEVPLYSKTLFIRMPESATGAYTIPEGITTIIPEAFSFCQKLEAVVIPATVREIGELAFQYCAIRSIQTPEGAKVADNAFVGCKYLKR